MLDDQFQSECKNENLNEFPFKYHVDFIFIVFMQIWMLNKPTKA